MPLFSTPPVVPSRTSGRETFSADIDTYNAWVAGTLIPELTAAALAWGPGQPYCTVSGTANAITLTSGLNLSALVAGQRAVFLAASTNTGTVTIDLDSLGAVAATDYAGAAIGAGYIVAGHLYQIIYSGGAWIVIPFLGAGGGGTVTQLTSKATAVTINRLSGVITSHDANLNAGASVTFRVNNALVAASDVISVSNQGAAGRYFVWPSNVGAGQFDLTIENKSGLAFAQAVPINFIVCKVRTS